MGLFSKKDKEESAEPKVKIDKKKDRVTSATYKVVLKEKLGSNTRTIKEIEASRFVDPDDHVVYLQSEKDNFFEIFPEDMNQFVTYEEKEVKSKLKLLREALKKERDDDDPEVNDKNLEFEILKYAAIERSFKFDKSASYVTFDTRGQPTFYFLRHGSTFYPFKWDSETKTIYTPSDNKKKKAAIALRNKRSKYKVESAIQLGTVGVLALAIIGFMASGYMLYKSYQTFSTNEINEAKLACLQSLEVGSKNLEQSAFQIKGIVTDLDKQLNKPQTVISGVAPR